jgi:hypothetical protein
MFWMLKLILPWALKKKKSKRKPTRSPPPPPVDHKYHVLLAIQIYKLPCAWFLIDLGYRVLNDLKGIICLSTESVGAEAARTSSPGNKSSMIVVSSPPPWCASHVPRQRHGGEVGGTDCFPCSVTKMRVKTLSPYMTLASWRHKFDRDDRYGDI